MDNFSCIKLNTGNFISEIYCGKGCLSLISDRLKGHGNFVVTDSNVYEIYRDLIEKTFPETKVFVLKAGEESKNFDSLRAILEDMISVGLHRNSYLFALGGGVIGDIGGLAASLYMRGIHCVQIPTTLLSQVDSSVGGKTAVDVGKVKNVVGAFYQPELVLADPDFLKTLPEREIRCGLGEIIKHGGLNGEIFDKLYNNSERLFDLDFLSGIIPDNIRHKASVVERDEKESGLRKSLNMGHTTGHALELFFGEKSHGEYVLTGMYYEILLGEKIGICDTEYTKKLKELIVKVTGVPEVKGMGEAAYLAKMDKKNVAGDKIAMIIPVSRGEYEEVVLPFGEYEDFLKRV